MSKPIFRLYTRTDCHLCDEMKTALDELRVDTDIKVDFDLEVYDIDLHEHLKEQFNELVPVLMWGQEILCYHRLDKNALKAALG